MEDKVVVIFGRVDAVTANLRKAVLALGRSALREFFHEIDLWAVTVSDGRSPLGTLNDRYEIFVLESASPAPWMVAAFDTSTREFIVCALLPDRLAPPIARCAELCATALGEPVRQVK